MIYSEIVLLVKAHNKQDVRDWILHYNTFEFDRIVIFDNDSNVNIKKSIVNIDHGNIQYNSIIGWSNQSKLYTNYIKQTDARWTVFIDDDEFLYYKEPIKINEFLSRYENFAGLTVNWQMISSLECCINRPTKSVIDYCLYTSNTGVNTHVKTFVNPTLVDYYLISHLPKFTENNFAVDYDRNLSPIPACGNWNNNILLYHYWVKSKRDWNKKKLKGRPSAENEYRTDSYEFSHAEIQPYITEDRTILNYKNSSWEMLS